MIEVILDYFVIYRIIIEIIRGFNPSLLHTCLKKRYYGSSDVSINPAIMNREVPQLQDVSLKLCKWFDELPAESCLYLWLSKIFALNLYW